jgi:hypothetical protein
LATQLACITYGAALGEAIGTVVASGVGTLAGAVAGAVGATAGVLIFANKVMTKPESARRRGRA